MLAVLKFLVDAGQLKGSLKVVKRTKCFTSLFSGNSKFQTESGNIFLQLFKILTIYSGGGHSIHPLKFFDFLAMTKKHAYVHSIVCLFYQESLL